MALRGRGSALNSTAVIRWYSGRGTVQPGEESPDLCLLFLGTADQRADLFAHLLDHALLHLRAGVELFSSSSG